MVLSTPNRELVVAILCLEVRVGLHSDSARHFDLTSLIISVIAGVVLALVAVTLCEVLAPRANERPSRRRCWGWWRRRRRGRPVERGAEQQIWRVRSRISYYVAGRREGQVLGHLAS